MAVRSGEDQCVCVFEPLKRVHKVSNIVNKNKGKRNLYCKFWKILINILHGNIEIRKYSNDKMVIHSNLLTHMQSVKRYPLQPRSNKKVGF